MWSRDVDGLRLTFHLAGINNQNFLMRDQETGSYWQQITGRAISGPLAGKQLKLVPCDELSFRLWRTEDPQGTVLQDVPKYAADYSPEDWDVHMRKVPTVISFARPGIAARDLMFGINAFGAARAFPYDRVIKERLVEDRVGSEPVLLVVGPDDLSVRAFRARFPGASATPQFYRAAQVNGSPALMMDADTGSSWNFEGCAVDGKAKGTCLNRVEVIKDYWFDWRNYNPNTTVYEK